ncbi:class I SAM-dependent methyltransferase [Streptomyces ovatisporus]|uniref:Class I SAM-dependent methyltransferase n=1 Tax=Streptomyces ovatisporus TaxID=1128682 RepID=A0ABV9A440_9ACTN
MHEQEWRHYVARYHDTRSGITERLFQQLDASPYRWLAGSLRPEGPVLDLACGSAPLRAVLPDADWAGIDSSTGELARAAGQGRGPLVRGSADALPVASGAVDAVCASMCLPVLTPLGQVLDEVRRVLRPGGMLAVLVPARMGPMPSGLLGWLRVMWALRAVRQSWPNPEACDNAAAVLRRAGFLVESDERRVFRLPLENSEDASRLVDALYLPGLTPQRAEAAKSALGDWAEPGRALPLPLRRVVARTPDHRSTPSSTRARTGGGRHEQ